MAGGLRVQEFGGRWVIAGDGGTTPALANEFLGYLADRNYSPRTVRGYAFDLLHFARWLDGEDLRLEPRRESRSEKTVLDDALLHQPPSSRCRHRGCGVGGRGR